MANPLIQQGVLNRLKGTITWNSFSALNVTPSYLAKAAIRLALEGEIASNLPTLTGTVPSPEPYVACSCVFALVKSQPFSDQYKQQWELNAVLGAGTVYPDINEGTGLGLFQLNNMVIANVAEMSFAGEDPAIVVTTRGYYLVNSALWN